MLMSRLAIGAVISAVLTIQVAQGQDRQPHNVILFVPDGLRALKVTPETAPAMAALREKGVNFKDPHSLFPTFTTANASAFATGHHLGDTGDFSNTIYVGRPVAVPDKPATVTPFLENDRVLADVDKMFGGNYLNEETLLAIARSPKYGYSTAAIGKVGPIRIFDHTDSAGLTIIIDDATGNSDKDGQPSGIALSAEVKTALAAAQLDKPAPKRGANGSAGDFQTPGTKVPNLDQQKYFTDVATKVVLPLFKSRNKPFLLVFWSRDPDGTQHFHGDGPNALVPGINGPTSLAAIKNADDNLVAIQQALVDLGLAETTNIIVAADHGFSTISKQSATSPAARASYPKVLPGLLPPGFLAIDLATALGLPLFNPDNGNKPVGPGTTTGNGVIGKDATKPDVVVAANGGSDLIYLPNKNPKLAARVVDALLQQDYVSGIFVDDQLGQFPGALPLSKINLRGPAVTPHPSIVVSFRSFSTGCDQPVLCTVSVADTSLQQGQGMHGSFSRADTMNFMAAIGPDFKSGFSDEAPVSNADVGRTIAAILGLKVPNKGKSMGRVISEAMPNGKMPWVASRTEQSAAGPYNLRTTLLYKVVGDVRYLDVAGFPGRTVGLDERR